jgi:hypothetical protein
MPDCVAERMGFELSVRFLEPSKGPHVRLAGASASTNCIRRIKSRAWMHSASVVLIGSAPICFSHFFDSWKQHRSGEGGQSRPHSLRRVAVGAKRRALTGLPRSVHSPAEKWEITRSRGRRVFPAALSFCPPAAAAQGTRPTRLSAALRGL